MDSSIATFGWPYTPATSWNATSTTLLLNQGVMTLASSTIFRYDSVLGTTTNATSTQLNVSTHLRSEGTTRLDGLTSALVLAGSTGVLAEYTGIDCTNQFVRDVSAAGAGTCATIVAADVDLADLTATDSTLTFSGAYDGQTARTVGVALGADFTWTGRHDLGGAVLELPNGTGPTVDAVGEIALDTTSGNVIIATSSVPFVIGSASSTLYAFSVSSTSPDFISGGIIDLPAHPLKQQAVAIMCHVDAGTSAQIFLSDGTNDTNTLTCTTTRNTYPLTANNIWTANEAIRLEVGTISGTPDYVIIRVLGFRTSD